MLDIVIAPPVRRKLRSFLKTVEDPAGIQGKLLMRIIRRHQDTGFGRDHGFASIRNLGDFRRALPISGYERMSPYIDRMRRGDYRALLADQKIHMFALTSGTTATRKLIPVNSSYLTSYRRGWNLWGLRAFQDHVKIPMTPIVQMSGDWREELTEGNSLRRRDRPDGDNAESNHQAGLRRAWIGGPGQGSRRQAIPGNEIEHAKAGWNGFGGQPINSCQPGQIWK